MKSFFFQKCSSSGIITDNSGDSSPLNIDHIEIPVESYSTDGEEGEELENETEEFEDVKQLEEGNLKRKNQSKDVI